MSEDKRVESWPADLSARIAVSEEFRQVIRDGNVNLAAGTAAKIAKVFYSVTPLSEECMGLMREMYEEIATEAGMVSLSLANRLLPIMDKLNEKLHFKP